MVDKFKAVSVLVIVIILFTIGTKLGDMSNPKNINGNTYKITQVVQAKEIEIKQVEVKPILINKTQNNKGKVLIYSSHSCEKNLNSTVTDIGEDLAKKLEKKGFQVEHIKTDFANEQGYNKSYYASGNMLDKKNLKDYILIIDLHMDADNNPISTKVKDNDVARLMFPNVSENPNLIVETKLVQKIRKGLGSFDDNIFRENVTHYKKGISYYNLNKSPNMILMEVGGNNDNLLSCKRANTLVSSAIERAIN